jgi:hypothetical protein
MAPGIPSCAGLKLPDTRRFRARVAIGFGFESVAPGAACRPAWMRRNRHILGPVFLIIPLLHAHPQLRLGAILMDFRSFLAVCVRHASCYLHLPKGMCEHSSRGTGSHPMESGRKFTAGRHRVLVKKRPMAVADGRSPLAVIRLGEGEKEVLDDVNQAYPTLTMCR